MEAVLITGGAGFIGSNFIPYFLSKNLDKKVINLDCLTYAADLANLTEVQNNTRYKFIEGDICNKDLLENLFIEYKFKGVINFAAESHVDNSIKKPDSFIQTNIIGTYNLLEVSKNLWLDSSNKLTYKQEFKNSRFHHISTDEVYGSLQKDGLFT